MSYIREIKIKLVDPEDWNSSNPRMRHVEIIEISVREECMN